MHFGLSEEQQMIVDTVRSFVENEVYPYEDEVEKTGEVPEAIGQAIMEKTKELGFYACNFPEEVGGAGLNHLEFALVERELGRGSMALTHFFREVTGIKTKFLGFFHNRLANYFRHFACFLYFIFIRINFIFNKSPDSIHNHLLFF